MQLAAFTKQVPFTYFAFAGINNVYSNKDQNKICRYYMSETYRSAAAAEAVRKQLVRMGFANAQVIDIIKEKMLCDKNDPAASQGMIYTNIMTEQLCFRNLYFDFDKHILKSESEDKLEALVAILKANPSWRVYVSGHTDCVGSPEYNVKLSKRRAGSARSYLINHGIHSNRIDIKVFGESTPIALNYLEDRIDAPEGRRYNRRVVVTVTDAAGEVVIDETRINDVPGHLRINKQTLREHKMYAEQKKY